MESSRCEEMLTSDGRQIAASILVDQGIEGLIVIGGNGSYRGAAALSKETKTKVVGIPGTIDNDIYGTDYTVGFDTAINTALEAIDRIRDTADAFERVFFIEVMGRKSGFIALEVGIAGGAEEILIPEINIEPEHKHGKQPVKSLNKQSAQNGTKARAQNQPVKHTPCVLQETNHDVLFNFLCQKRYL